MASTRNDISRPILRIALNALFAFLPIVQASGQWVPAGGPEFSSISMLSTDSSGTLFAGCDDRILALSQGGTRWNTIARHSASCIFWMDRTSFIFGDMLRGGLFLFNGKDSSFNSLVDGQVRAIVRASDNSIIVSSSFIWISKDNGISWRRPGTFEGMTVEGLAKDTGGAIIAGVSSGYIYGGGLYRSTDNGSTWTRFAFADTYGDRVWINSKNTYFYHGYRSTDGGKTWSKMPGGWYGFDNLVFSPGGAIYGSSRDSLYTSLDDGINWTFVDHANGNISTLHISQKGDLYVGTDSSGAYVMTVGNNVLKPLTREGLSHGRILSLAIDLNHNIFVGARNDWTGLGGIYRSSDMGQNWDWLVSGLLEMRSVLITPNHTVFFGNVYGTIYKSTDNGDHWVGRGGELKADYPRSFAIDKNGNVFAGLIYGVGISSDNGETWKQSYVRYETYHVDALAAAPDGGMFAGTGGGLFYSSDLGVTWTEVGLPGVQVRTIVLVPRGSIFAGSVAGDLWRSTNIGVNWNWTNVVSKPFSGAPICAVANSLGHIFVGTGSGVFLSRDNGNSWTDYSGGLTVKTINALAVDPDGFLYAGSEGDGVFRTSGSTTKVPRVEAQPEAFALLQNYPNPFNPSTTIRYKLAKKAIVSIKIFNTLGQIVAALVDEQKEAGYLQVQWNANVPSGIYFYRLQAGEFVETKKMILLK